MTEALTSNYWISPNAVRITLNAMGKKDYIQCGATGGAVIMCYIRDVDGLGYDAGHNYRRWPIVTAPVYFNSWTRKYVYIAIPRSTAVGTSAILVFPSKHIDLYGMTEPAEGETEGEQIGSKDYYYIFLRGVISPSRSDDDADQLREWEEYVDYGTLSTDQQISEGDSEWWRYNADDDTVTFLKVITNATFKVLNVLKNLTVGGDGSFGGSLSVAKDAVVGGLLTAVSAVINSIKSTNYSGSGMADTGWSITNDNGSGSSEAVFDYLTVRKKMTINSLEIKETTFSAGDIAQSCASAEIVRTDYYHVDANGGRTLLGYSNIRSPWWLRGAVLLLGKNKAWGKYGIFSRYKKVRISLTMNELKECNRIRCYFLAKDGDRNIENWWRVNDLARCQTWNITGQTRQTYEPDWDTKTVGNVYWWRKIHDVSWNTGEPRYVMKDAAGNPVPAGNNYENTTTDQNDPDVYANEANIKRLATNGTYSNSVDEAHAPVEIDGKTYHWFEVDYGYAAEQAGATGWCDYKSDLPAAGDKVVQFGNTTDPDRMNVTISEINGSGNPDAPAIKMFRGIYTFDINLSWWGNVHQPPIKISPATGIHLFAPSFEWGTEYGTAKQIIERQEGYWSSIALEYDDNSRLHPVADPDEDTYYPRYSDDITNTNGEFISRGGFIIVDGEPVYGSIANPIPKNYVRKCRYYDRVSHNGSSWLCVIAEQKYWRVKEGYSVTAADGTTYNSFDRIPTDIAVLAENKIKTEYVRSYTFDEPTPASNDWMEQVQKGGFKSRVFLRSNIQPQTPSNLTPAGTEYNTYDNPVPPPTKIMDEEGHVIRTETWTDGIPQGDEILWSCTCWFYAPGKHSDWTTPASETDNEKLDVEFSMDYNQPNAPYSGSSFTPDKRGDGTAYGTSAGKNKRANGSGEEANWYDPEADKDNTHAEWDKMIWRAERRIANGEYSGTWAISRIKGEAGATPITAYRWYKDDLFEDPEHPFAPTAPTANDQNPAGTEPDTIPSNKMFPNANWSQYAPNRPADGWTLFMTQSQIFDDGSYGAWTTPVQISGATGSPGIDSSDMEWIYKFDQSGYDNTRGEVNPTDAARDITDDKQQNGWVPVGWYDHAQGVDKNHTILYASFRRKSAGRNQTWGDFQPPIIWSHFGRNGMDGDGVEYVFMRTKNNVAPTFTANDGGSTTDYKQEEWLPYINNNDSTKSDVTKAWAESNRCTDDPKGTTREWPYEWVAKRTMGMPNADTGAREWKSYYECTTEGSGASETHKMSLWGNHAENVMRLDISNEMDMIPTDSAGNISANRIVETIVRLFDGATEVTLGEVTVSGGPATSGDGKIANYSQTQSDKGRRLAWQFLKDKTMADSYAITINYTYLDIPYEAVFTVAASKGQPIFQLKPSMSSIPFARNQSDNTLTPSDRKVGIEIEKIDGLNSNTYTSTSGTGVVVRYSFDAMPTNTSITTTQKAWTSGTITVDNTKDNLFVAMFKGVDGPLLDRESIPVIRDGANGTSPWIADLDNEMDSVACDADGRPVQLGGNNQIVRTNFKLFYGSTSKEFYVSSVSPSSTNGMTVTTIPNSLGTADVTGRLEVQYEGDPTKNRVVIDGKHEFVVTLKSKDDNKITRDLTFTVNGIKPGPDGKTPSIYNLLPSVSEILVGRTGGSSDIEFVPVQVATDMWDDFIIDYTQTVLGE